MVGMNLGPVWSFGGTGDLPQVEPAPVDQSVLMMHGSRYVTLDALRRLTTPEPMGSWHRPVPHHILVATIMDQIAERGWSVAKSRLGIAGRGHRLFGVLDLRRPAGADTLGVAFGFRSSTNESLAIRGVAGARVFVCDNLALSGEEFVMRRKSTTRLHLPLLVSEALDRFLGQSKQLLEDIYRLRESTLSDRLAKIRIFDLFNAGALPLHLFDDVSQLYFSPEDDHPDCSPRSLWGLHNACTRAIKRLKPAPQFISTIRVGRQFQLASGRGPQTTTV